MGVMDSKRRSLLLGVILILSILCGCIGGSEKENYQSPTCAISANPNSGTAPFTVTFSISASENDGSIVSWTLDTDNDGTPEYSGAGIPPSTQQHTYNNAGTYNAKLTVNDDNTGVNHSDTCTIIVSEPTNQQPTCAISANPNSGTAPLIVTFSISASDTDGSIASWSLDTDNDGNVEYSGTGNPPSTKQYTYHTPGTFTAKLWVTDDDGATKISSITIGVSEAPNQSPTCSLSANPSSGYVPLLVTFSLSASDSDGIINYWGLDIDNDGDDDYSGTGNPPSTKQYTYHTPGTFTAKLWVTDDDGATKTATRTVNVAQNPPPQPINFQGYGDAITGSFTLQEGIAICNMYHNGPSNFIMWLYNAQTAEREELLVNEIGNYDGEVVIGVASGFSGDVEPGTYLIEVTAGGSWEINIEQPRPTQAQSLPKTYSGNGDTVPSPFMLETGLVRFDMTHSGSSNFIIWLYSNEGEREELLANEIGSYSGSELISVSSGWGSEAEPGIHYIEIKADGNWQVSITTV